ncbi:hypothetical protein MKX01_029883 [Papaver californicum]|nr:hypothetical protein MKX01_029883 [Papaver californicum]
MSSSSATVGVDKATSDLLVGPDWTMNINICDSINSHRWQAKDVIKALKKRLQHGNPKVQLLALTLLETMVKNCGDIVHFQIADRNILQEMIKIVRKKMDMHVRDKILVLLDSWQEAFGGAGGKYPQYYWAYEELRRSGVQFPERSRDAAPIHTPPVAASAPRHFQAGYGMPSDTSRRLDEAMASETGNLSMANLYSMRSVQELLSDMLQAVNPTDRESIKDEVIVDLVSQCRSNQRKLMQMLTSTGDEQLLCQGLELNDSLQSVLAKHDAIASGSPLPSEVISNSGSPLPAEVINNSASPVPTEVRDASPRSNPAATSIASATSSQLEEEEEEDDDFAQLARRRTKATALSSETSVQGDGAVPPPSTSSPSNALVLTTPPPAVRTSTATKEQDIIDLLSITLSTTSVSPHAPQSNTNQNMNQVPYSTTPEVTPYGSQVYTENQGQATNSNYVAPWAQPQPQMQQWAAPQPQPWAGQQSQPRPQQWAAQQAQPQPQQWAAQQSQPQPQQWAAQQAQPQPQQTQPWVQHQAQPQQARAQPQPWAEQQAPQEPQQQPRPQAQPQQPQSQPQPQPWVQQAQAQPQTQPWAQPQSQQWGQQQAQGQSQAWAQRQQQSQPQLQAQQSFKYPPPPWATATTTTTQVAKSLQSHNSFPARVSNGSAISEGHKPFIPSYRLFEDLNVLGSPDGTNNNSPRMSGQSMLGGRK